MIRPEFVTPVVVTRGDVDLTDVLAPFAAVGTARPVVWDNSKAEHDLGVYGRYEAARQVATPFVFALDDDVALEPAQVGAIILAARPGRLTANMPRARWDDYPDSALVGWGSVFEPTLAREAFDRVPELLKNQWLEVSLTVDDATLVMFEPGAFYRDCDVVFSALSPRTIVDVGFAHLPWAETPDRLFLDPTHAEKRELMLAACRAIRTWRDDDRRGP